MEREAEIVIKVKLDEQSIPKEIEWIAPESGSDQPQKTNAFMLSLWDHANKNTLGIDLWTDKMTVDEMNIYFFQTLFKMSQTFENATKDVESAKMIKEFADKFAEHLNSKNQKG